MCGGDLQPMAMRTMLKPTSFISWKSCSVMKPSQCFCRMLCALGSFSLRVYSSTISSFEENSEGVIQLGMS